MSGAQLMALLPLIILGGTPIVVMLVLAIRRSHEAAVILTLVGLGASFAALSMVYGHPPRQVTPLLIMDRFTAVYMALLLFATGATAVLSYSYLKWYSGNTGEFYILLLLAATGAAVLTASNHFASLFLGYEILSVSLYALIAYPRLSSRHLEAGLKYLILAAASSAFLIFGIALLYAGSGSLEFKEISTLLRSAAFHGEGALLLTGAAMMTVGLGFKLAVVPFHLWTPDVYQGAPAPVTGFVSTVSKGGVVALLVRFFLPAEIQPGGSLFLMFSFIAIASMVVGNLLALLQDNIKRILAYSSIAHLGYLLVAFLTAGSLAVTAITIYLLAYFIMTLGAFGVISMHSGPEREAEHMDDYRGLFWSRPWFGGVFVVMLLSLAGIPLTAGFMGKFYVVAAAVGSARWNLVVVLVVTSTIGLFYYLRMVATLFVRPSGKPATAPALPLPGRLMLAILLVLLFWVGVLPTYFINLIQLSLH